MAGRDVRIIYAPVKSGRRYWQPTKAMIAEGAPLPRALGSEGHAAQQAALALLAEWTAIRDGVPLPRPRTDTAEIARAWPPGSIGACFAAYMRTNEWARKEASTRNRDILPAWAYTRDAWGDCDPNTITLELLSEWRAELVRRHGLGVAHRAFKEWRRHWKVMVAMRVAHGPDPSLGIRNDSLPPRWQTWSEGEVVRIVKAGIRSGKLRLACMVAVVWDTNFSPGDVRTLRAKHLASIGGDPVMDRREDGRQKTGKAAIGTLSRRTLALLRAYLPENLLPAALLFPTSTGRALAIPVFAREFRALCETVFPGDKRQLRDMRRSGTVEAFAGGAQPADVATKNANALNQSDRLFRTYNPVDLASVRRADEARIRGRQARREANEK